MWNWSRIPSDPLVNHATVYGPRNAAWAPVDRVKMKFYCGVKPELYSARRTPIAKLHRRSVVSGIEIDVDQHAVRVIAG